MNNKPSTIQDIRNEISLGHLSKAMQEFRSMLDPDLESPFYTKLLALEARYAFYKRRKNQGLKVSEEEQNEIIYELIQLTQLYQSRKQLSVKQIPATLDPKMIEYFKWGSLFILVAFSSVLGWLYFLISVLCLFFFFLLRQKKRSDLWLSIIYTVFLVLFFNYTNDNELPSTTAPYFDIDINSDSEKTSLNIGKDFLLYIFAILHIVASYMHNRKP